MTTIIFMHAIRRRLASGALALTVLQFTLLFAAPLSACCEQPAAAERAAARVAADEIECCPPGTHPPGQCPRHRKAGSAGAAKSADRRLAATRGDWRDDEAASRGGTSESRCRVMCDAPHGAEFVLGVVGLLPHPQSHDIAATTDSFECPASFVPSDRASLPDAPPPRFL
jgi:hypothetical protein